VAADATVDVLRAAVQAAYAPDEGEDDEEEFDWEDFFRAYRGSGSQLLGDELKLHVDHLKQEIDWANDVLNSDATTREEVRISLLELSNSKMSVEGEIEILSNSISHLIPFSELIRQ
jgi:hypothetical protein